MREVPDQSEELVFAYYVTGHGFGHATRVVEVARHLVARGHVVHIVSGAPDFVFKREIPSPKLHVRKVLLDCGAVQSDALTVDRQASLEKYSETAVLPRESILDTESKWLRSIKANLVVSDIVPVACRAAVEADIPSICVSNFSWDFIYADYVTAAGHKHQSIIWQIAEDYSHALFLIRLPGYCPMPAFRDVVDVPLVVREVRKTREQVRKEFGIPEDKKIVVFNFGGQLANWCLKEEFLPPGWVCLVCGAAPDFKLPPNFIGPGRDAYTPDLIAASDCMLGKIGYGTVSEALAYKVPLVFIRRDYFNEEPFLRNMLESYRCGVEMIRRDFLSGQWEPYLKRSLQLKPCYDGAVNGGETVAKILEHAAVGNVAAVRKESGARRLRDAIVFGYQIQRVPGREVTIPEWYTQRESRYGLLNVLYPGVPEELLNHRLTSISDIGVEEFEILHGELHGLADTALFLKSLAKLETEVDSPLRERVAAAGIFSWEEEMYVARAPGRLDVMGGIADYSGSLVLQMPIREACHVAVQRNPPGKQRMWKHIAARHFPGFKPVIQIVSLGSELSNRAPTFDMDLSDFFDSRGEPLSYEEARKYFSKDSSQRWAAYVAGTILVLIRELGITFEDCISILVSSAVPEGKGVSSSAAVEVATMSGIAAAYGLKIEPRKLALLCQKVENLVVGAPCGVMDQMASACGEANKLLAMVCQPAEVKEHVNIPTHVRFWGLDSGIRHSVGGADYGSVRVGAFMGRQIIAHSAAEKLSVKQETLNGFDEVDEVETEQYREERDLTYLCNLTTERYEASYMNVLPDTIEGSKFLEKYGSHKDSVTTISPHVVYPVKAPTGHPIYENSRVEAFALLLEVAAADSIKQLHMLGQLMYQSHLSYSKCGLGSAGTDRLVALVKHMQRQKASEKCLFGAKISGGGCGGTVCVVSTAGVEATKQILEVQERYKEATGHLPFIFEGSSPGAGKFGYLKIKRRK